MRFYYTTSAGTDTVQTKPNISLGGFKSISPVHNADFNNLFDELSVYTITKENDEFIGLVLKNETGKDVVNIELWFVHPEDCYTKYQIAGVEMALNADGEYFMERIPTKYSAPFYADFVDADTETKYYVDSIPADGMIGIWIKRHLLLDFIKEDSSDVYEPSLTDPRIFVAKEKSTSDAVEIHLTWEQDTQTYNLEAVISGDTYYGIEFVLPEGDAYDLTGATAEMQVKLTPTSTPVLTFSSPSGLLIDTVLRKITLPEQIIVAPPAIYSYYLRITFLDGRVRTYVTGTWEIKAV